jgi:nucleobase:cation symporter-1, NCS1 family
VAIEHKSIDYIAEDERHGRVIDQTPFWFLGNFHFFTIAIAESDDALRRTVLPR